MQDQTIILKLLCNVHRFAIMKLLIASREHLCVNQIATETGISQSLASQQLSRLVAHGLIEGTRMGQTTCYAPTASSRMKKVKQIIRILS